MNYLQDIVNPFLLSALIFGVSILTFGRIDFYASMLSLLYFVFSSISNAGSRYLDITRSRESLKPALKMFTETPAVFALILAICYILTANFHWLFIILASFTAVYIFVTHLTDWDREREIEKKSK